MAVPRPSHIEVEENSQLRKNRLPPFEMMPPNVPVGTRFVDVILIFEIVVVRPEPTTMCGVLMVSCLAPGPMISVSSTVGIGESSEISPDTLENVITSTPGLSDALVKASRNEPGPESSVLVTTKVAARPENESVNKAINQRTPNAFVRRAFMVILSPSPPKQRQNSKG